MRGKLILSVFILLLATGIDAASGFSLKVDFGDVGQPVKPGWQEFTGNGNNEDDPKTEIYDVNGQSVSVSVRTGVDNDSGYRHYGGGDLGGDMVYPDNYNGPVNGRVILTLGNLPAGNYTLVSYHNDTKDSHAQQDPIDVTVDGAITGSTSDLDVVQTKSPDDSNLGSSTVSFAAEGTGDVNVVYTPTTSNGVVSKAVLNGFELDSAGAVPSVVQFDSSSSSDFESVSPVILSVVLSPATPNTVTVDYNVTGGTAEAVADYNFSAGTLTFDPNQTTPEYISISIVSDGTPENDETIEVTLSNPANALVGTKAQHTYTIVDPHPRVGFETAASEAREDALHARIGVSLSWTWPETVTVDYNVTGGTAAGGGADYTLGSGTLTFLPHRLTQYINIGIVEDAEHEDPDETVEITLSNPTKARLGSNMVHTFTILPPMARICPDGDVDGDCKVDGNDLRFLANQWLDPAGSCSGLDCADLDELGGVNMADYVLLAADWLQEAQPIVINEFMASNDSDLEDPQEPGEYPDWFELHNAGELPLNIGGLYLTDDLARPTRWQIPSGLTIGAGGYLFFYADDDDEQGDTHTNFKLDADGEEIGLFDSDGLTLIDSIEFGPQHSDISFGRYPDASDTLRFFSRPTPGVRNMGGYMGEVADTKFSHDRGLYESSFNLSMTCATAGAKIHYTLNGSEPDQSVGDGTYLYVVPINISSTTTIRAAAFKPGYLPSDADAQTYIFLDDVVNQAGMDPCVVATYSSVIEDAFQSVPTLSIVMDACDLANLQLQDSRPGYPNPKEELSASAELIYADANQGEGFQINCGIEGHSWPISKRSYKLLFKTAFGPSQLRYPFFESASHNGESAVDELDRIVLRASKNMEVTYAGDQWTRDSQIAMSDLSARGVYVHLYLNGTYWGLYNATERPDAWFTSSYLGGQKEDYFATNHGIERGEDHISGDPDRFDTMISMAQDKLLENPGNYETFKGLCDATNFADYTILFWFSGFGDNIDNNWYGGMRNVPLVGSVPPEGFMMLMWDAEYVFQNRGGPPGNSVPWVPSYYFSMSGYTIPDVWNALRENDDFMMLFADRIYKHCFNEGALTEENAQTRWDTITSDINEAAICEQARWGEGLPPEAVDMNGFVDIFMAALDDWGGLYPTIDPPLFNQQGGHVAVGFGLTMTDPCGAEPIYYTLDGSDPREPVTANPVGTLYGPTMTLNKSRHVKARVLKAGEWSALNEAVFAVGPIADRLRITEIMYHPNDTGNPNDPNTEFIELKNVGIDPINLNLVSFTDGVGFTFPDVNLMPGSHALVVKDQNAFAAKYGLLSSIAGEYSGSLRNGGEQITLEDAIGQVILDFEYSDGWRSITDGNGFSLTIIDAGGDANSWSQKDSWRPSACLDGSPGWDDAGILPNPSAVVINEVMAHSHDLPDWIELYNTTAGPIDIGGWFLSDSDSNLTKYQIASGTTINAGQYMLFYEDVNFGHSASDPGRHEPFALSENGEQVVLSSCRDFTGHLTGYRQAEDFGASDSNVSFGRYYKASTDNYNFVAMDHNTPGASNAYPKVGPIAINEIMYHPDWPDLSWYDNESYEYIELRNITASDVNLYDEDSIPWKFTDAIEFTFPAEANIPAQGYMLVVKDPDAFSWLYGAAPTGVQVLGPYDGKLNNGGEKLELSKPGDVDQVGTRHYIRVDRINYSDGFHHDNSPDGVDHWPTAADGAGASLNRLSAGSYGNDPNNWGANTPSPGEAAP
ncbi:MAG: lamin tail domain-containing protein [Planctomycetota bacterium]